MDVYKKIIPYGYNKLMGGAGPSFLGSHKYFRSIINKYIFISKGPKYNISKYLLEGGNYVGGNYVGGNSYVNGEGVVEGLRPKNKNKSVLKENKSPPAGFASWCPPVNTLPGSLDPFRSKVGRTRTLARVLTGGVKPTNPGPKTSFNEGGAKASVIGAGFMVRALSYVNYFVGGVGQPSSYVPGQALWRLAPPCYVAGDPAGDDDRSSRIKDPYPRGAPPKLCSSSPGQPLWPPARHTTHPAGPNHPRPLMHSPRGGKGALDLNKIFNFYPNN